jgi:phosphohistidine phosphatase
MLWLLRHAEARDGAPDEARPLTERGLEHARAAGLALRRLGIGLDGCLSSPKLRAVQTARLACEPLGVPVTPVVALSGGPFDVRELTAGLGNVLLVGHDPSFTLTLHDLTGAQARIHKGGLAGVKKGELLVLLRPSEIAAIAAPEQAGHAGSDRGDLARAGGATAGHESAASHGGDLV